MSSTGNHWGVLHHQHAQWETPVISGSRYDEFRRDLSTAAVISVNNKK